MLMQNLGEHTKSIMVFSGVAYNEKISRKIGNAQSRAILFRHSFVLSLPAVLLRKITIVQRSVMRAFEQLGKSPESCRCVIMHRGRNCEGEANYVSVTSIRPP